MRFPTRARIPPLGEAAEPQEGALAGGDEIAIAISPASLSAGILNRFVTAAAARSGFSIDRVSDAQLVVDALAAGLATSLLGDRLDLAVGIGRGRLSLRLGPLRAGGSASVLDGAAVAELGSIVARLVDESSTDRDGIDEFLTLVMRDGRGAPPVNIGG